MKKLTKDAAVKLGLELITIARNQPDGEDIGTHIEHTSIKKDKSIYLTITIPYDEPV